MAEPNPARLRMEAVVLRDEDQPLTKHQRQQVDAARDQVYDILGQMTTEPRPATGS